MKKVISWKTTSSSGVRFGSALSALVEADMGRWASGVPTGPAWPGPAGARRGGPGFGSGQDVLACLAALTSELIVRSAILVASIVSTAIRLRKKAKKKIAGTESETPSR